MSAVRLGRVAGHPGYLLKRAQATLNAAMTGVLREHGATLAQYAVVTALDEEPGLSNAGLARRAFVTPQTMNQVLRELEQKGWVARHPDPAHARILQADLTPGRPHGAAGLQAGGQRCRGTDARPPRPRRHRAVHSDAASLHPCTLSGPVSPCRGHM